MVFLIALMQKIQEVATTSSPPQFYTVPELIMLLGAVGAMLTGVIASVGNLILAIRTNERLKENTVITAATLTKTAVIEGHVNSERTQANEKIISAIQLNEELRKQLDEQNRVATTLANAATQALLVAAAIPDPNRPHNQRAEDKPQNA